MTESDYDTSYLVNEDSKAQLAKLEQVLQPYGLRLVRQRPRTSGNADIAANTPHREYGYAEAWRTVDDGMGNINRHIAQVIIAEGYPLRLRWMSTGEPVSLAEFESDLKGIERTYHAQEFTEHTVNRVLVLLSHWMNPEDELNKSNQFPTADEVDAFYASKLPFNVKLAAIRQDIKFEELAMYDDFSVQQVRALLGV